MDRTAVVLVAAFLVGSSTQAAEEDGYFKLVSYERYEGERTFIAGVPFGGKDEEDSDEDLPADRSSCQCPTFGPCENGDWYGGVEAVFLQRNRPRNHALSIFDDQDRVVIDTNDLVFDYEWGYRVNFGRRYNENTSVEVSFLNLTSWSADAWVPTPDPSDPHLDPYWGSQVGLPTDSFDTAYAHYFTYNSKLRDAELNTRFFIDSDTSLTFGFRYINVNENFFWYSQDNLAGSRFGVYDIGTSNDLFGLQAGISRQWCCTGRVSFGVYGKAGVFYNNIDTDNHLVNVTDSGIDRDERINNSDNTFSTVVDLGLMGTYCVCEGVRIRAGYTFVFINNLALAPEQLSDAPNQFALKSWVSDNGSLIYQGPTASIDFCW